MRDETIARSYAGTLFELARRHEGLDAYGEAIEAVASLLEENPRFRLFLETPRIEAAQKKEVLRKAFDGKLPEHVVRFLLVTIDKRRQRLLRQIAREFHLLVDEHMDRTHVDVTVARSPDDETVERIVERFSGLLGKTAVPHVHVDPEILGGVIVRTGDTIYDGSLRRRLGRVRRRLLETDLPDPAVVGLHTTED